MDLYSGFLNYWINYHAPDGDIRKATKTQSALIGFSTGASEVRLDGATALEPTRVCDGVLAA